MWNIWDEAAILLALPERDWRVLQQIEALLSALSVELESATSADTVAAQHESMKRRVSPDLRLLESLLTWVRRHEYDALETELQNRLETAQRYAGHALERIEEPQAGMQPPSSTVFASSAGP